MAGVRGFESLGWRLREDGVDPERDWDGLCSLRGCEYGGLTCFWFAGFDGAPPLLLWMALIPRGCPPPARWVWSWGLPQLEGTLLRRDAKHTVMPLPANRFLKIWTQGQCSDVPFTLFVCQPDTLDLKTVFVVVPGVQIPVCLCGLRTLRPHPDAVCQ